MTDDPTSGPSQASPPAGWYADAASGGAQRWWDGHSWGDFAPTSPGGYAQLPPLAPKEVGIAYLLMLFVFIGVAGIPHFYLGKIGRGVLWLLTGGLFGIGIIIDLFTMPGQVRDINARRAVGIR